MNSIDPLRLSPTLANRKSIVLDFIRQYYSLHRKGPSYSEMAAAARTNRSRVSDVVRRLERDGMIHRRPGVAHSVTPIDAREDAIRILREAGYVVDQDILRLSPPVTNAELLGPPVLDHPPDDNWGDEGGNGEGAQGKIYG